MFILCNCPSCFCYGVRQENKTRCYTVDYGKLFSTSLYLAGTQDQKTIKIYMSCHGSFSFNTGPDGAVAMSSANGQVGTGVASRCWLQPGAGF